MERPSRSAIFRQNMKIKREQREAQSEKEQKPKLPVHKRRVNDKSQETR